MIEVQDWWFKPTIKNRTRALSNTVRVIWVFPLRVMSAARERFLHMAQKANEYSLLSLPDAVQMIGW